METTRNVNSARVGTRISLVATLLSFAYSGFAWFPTSTQADIVPIYEMYLATRVGDDYRRSADHQFSCDDAIYLFLESSDPALAEAVLETDWRNLESQARHQTRKPFARQKSGKRRYWSWGGIAFVGNDSGPLGSIASLMDPVAGREKFIGRWNIRVLVMDRYDKSLEINVLC